MIKTLLVSAAALAVLCSPAKSLEVNQVIDIVGGINVACDHVADTINVINATRHLTGMSNVTTTMRLINQNGLSCDMVTRGSFIVKDKRTTNNPQRSLFCINYVENKTDACAWILLKE